MVVQAPPENKGSGGMGNGMAGACAQGMCWG